jgi:hypothetical protein
MAGAAIARDCFPATVAKISIHMILQVIQVSHGFFRCSSEHPLPHYGRIRGQNCGQALPWL